MLARSCLRSARAFAGARNGAVQIAKVCYVPSHDRIIDDTRCRPIAPATRPCPSNRSWKCLLCAHREANLRVCQRAASSSSSGSTAESPLRLNIAAAAATAVAAGSIAWYYHLYGPTADAMTPAEEG